MSFQCAEAVGLKSDDVIACYKSNEGTNLQLVAEKDTIKIFNSPLKSVPTIIYNEVNKTNNNVLIKTYSTLIP